ncbi:MAG: SDR family oxidoreductase [Pseudomonadota bacterium]
MKRKVTLVTGAGRGIGQAACLELGRAGHDLAMIYHQDRRSAEQTASQVRKYGVQVMTIQADVRERAAISEAFRLADADLGPLTGLVNNAGIVGDKARLEDMSESRLEKMFATNVLGAIYCCQEAIRLMSPHHGGHGGSIVNVSSAAARIGAPGEYVDYAASKGAVDTLTLGLSKELAEEGIRVNCVRPGVIDTDIHASGGQPDRALRLSDQIPMRRPGQASEVANAICWLLSDAASYCTGTIIDVSGGR